MSVKDNYSLTRPSLLLDFASTKVLDPRITFSRASTAVFYDDNTVALAEQNLLTYSQEVDNAAWGKTNVTVTANSTSAPDGTTTADSLFETTATGFHGLTRSNIPVGNLATASVFVKANGRNFIMLYTNQGALGKYFDITAGGGGSVLGNYGTGPISAAIQYLGNDWYRCSMVYAATTNTLFDVYISDTGSNISYTGDVTKGIYIWGAQLESRSAVTAYTPTTTQPITTYIPVLQTAAAGVARFDHNPVTRESLGLLVEEQRSNLLTWSEDFSNAAWTKTRSSITANTIVAPDGTLTGDKFIPNTDNNTHPLSQDTTNASTAYTFSVYLKAGEYSNAQVIMSDLSTAAVGIQVNLAAGTFTTITGGSWTAVSGAVTSVGNGWYRCTTTATRGAGTQTSPRILPMSGGVTVFAGNGYSGIYIWGAQLE